MASKFESNHAHMVEAPHDLSFDEKDYVYLTSTSLSPNQQQIQTNNDKKSNLKKSKNKNKKKDLKKLDLDFIMNEQQIQKIQNYNDEYIINDLSQDILLESLSLAQKQKQNEKENNVVAPNQSQEISLENLKKNEYETNVDPKVSDSSQNKEVTLNYDHNALTNDQYYADLLMAMEIQQAEQNGYHQRKTYDEIYNGKYSKVRETAPTIKPEGIVFDYDYDDIDEHKSFKPSLSPKKDDIVQINNNNNTNCDVTLQNNDNNVNEKLKRKRHRRKNKANNNNNNNNDNKSVSSIQTNNNIETKQKTSKHDSIKWSHKHVERLKSYEVMGNIDKNEIYISNKAFNIIRHRLDQKGFVKDDIQQVEMKK